MGYKIPSPPDGLLCVGDVTPGLSCLGEHSPRVHVDSDKGKWGQSHHTPFTIVQPGSSRSPSPRKVLPTDRVQTRSEERVKS